MGREGIQGMRPVRFSSALQEAMIIDLNQVSEGSSERNGKILRYISGIFARLVGGLDLG